jgi:hypothetical protein
MIGQICLLTASFTAEATPPQLERYQFPNCQI